MRAATPAPQSAAAEKKTPAAPSNAAGTRAAGPSERDLAEIERKLRELNQNPTPATARTPIAPEPFDLKSLPRVLVPEPLESGAAPDETSGAEATELYVDWKGAGRPLGPPKNDVVSVRVTLGGHVVGRLRVGYAEGTTEADGSGGTYVACGGLATAGRRPVPARWEVVEATPKGSIEYHVTDAWFDTQSCTAKVVARSSVTASSFAGGMLHAFRKASAKSPEDEALIVISPRLSSVATTALGGDTNVAGGSFSRITIPVRRGGGASVVGRIAASTAHDWSQLMGIAPVATGELLVGLEISQGVDDSSPVAMAYLGVPRPTNPSVPGAPKAVPLPAKTAVFDPFFRN